MISRDYAAGIYQPFGKVVLPQSFPMTAAEATAYRVKVEEKRFPEDGAVIDKALFEREGHAHLPLRDYYETTGKRFWCLSPRGVSVFKLDDMKNNDTDISDSDLIYKTIMDCLLIKRSAQTPIKAPDGKVYYPRGQKPGLRVRV